MKAVTEDLAVYNLAGVKRFALQGVNEGRWEQQLQTPVIGRTESIIAAVGPRMYKRRAALKYYN
jgi:hypothetical protein